MPRTAEPKRAGLKMWAGFMVVAPRGWTSGKRHPATLSSSPSQAAPLRKRPASRDFGNASRYERSDCDPTSSQLQDGPVRRVAPEQQMVEQPRRLVRPVAVAQAAAFDPPRVRWNPCAIAEQTGQIAATLSKLRIR